MRGEDNKQEAMFSYVSPEKRVPTDHPLRPIRAMVDGNVRVVIVTGGAPGYFNRHFNIPALIQIAESLRASGRQWPENATYNGGFFDKAMALCEDAKAGNCGHLRYSSSRCLRVRALLRSSYCRGWRLPDRVAGGRPWSPSRCRRHAKAAAHHRNTSCTHAHPHGSATESA